MIDIKNVKYIIKKVFRGLLALITCAALIFASIIAFSKNETLLPTEKSIVDFHVHVAGLGYGESGCFINKEMRENFRFNFYLKAMDVTIKELEEHGDKVLFSKISGAIAKSSSISKAVILAMDGVIDKNGKLNKEQTQIYVPNAYVHQEVNKTTNLLFGASINPNRANAVELLEQVHQQGAVLIKWIPSIMAIDPSDEKFTAFYLKMAELNIPLLTHTGMEKSFSNAQDELADPLRLTLALSLGVKVIAAHIATTGHSEGEDNFERILPMFTQYPNLYADISSLTQINKRAYMKKVLAKPELKGRLIYGTDWPLQFFPIVSPWYHLDLIGIKAAWQVGKIKNQWDKDVAMKKAMGVDDEVFELGRTFFIK